MKESYLEVTYRGGKPLGAYYYLPRSPRDRSHRAWQPAPGLVVDFNRKGKPIGVEITAPSRVSVTAFNRVLRELGFAPVSKEDLAPLRAA